MGSLTNYADARAIADLLSDRNGFPVSDLIIIGVDLMQVKRVVGRLTRSKVLGGSMLHGLWTGLLFGLILGLLQKDWVSSPIVGLDIGVIFGIVLVTVPYVMQSDKRNSSTTAEIVARRCSVLYNLRNAKHARDLLMQRVFGGNRG